MLKNFKSFLLAGLAFTLNCTHLNAAKEAVLALDQGSQTSQETIVFEDFVKDSLQKAFKTSGLNKDGDAKGLGVAKYLQYAVIFWFIFHYSNPFIYEVVPRQDILFNDYIYEYLSGKKTFGISLKNALILILKFSIVCAYTALSSRSSFKNAKLQLNKTFQTSLAKSIDQLFERQANGCKIEFKSTAMEALMAKVLCADVPVGKRGFAHAKAMAELFSDTKFTSAVIEVLKLSLA